MLQYFLLTWVLGLTNSAPEPDADPGMFCRHRVQYIPHYVTVYKKIPQYETIYKDVIIEKPVTKIKIDYDTEVIEVVQTKLHPVYETVTEKVYVTDVREVIEYKTKFVTEFEPKFITATERIAQFKTTTIDEYTSVQVKVPFTVCPAPIYVKSYKKRGHHGHRGGSKIEKAELEIGPKSSES